MDKEFKQSNDVAIASGYALLDAMEAFDSEFIAIAKNGGCSKLLLGRVFYEGLSEKKLNFALSLKDRLRKYSDNSGVYVVNGRRYHRKVYRFNKQGHCNIYLGSSNFSASGTKGNIECTLQVFEESQKAKINSFLDDIYSNKYSVGIHKAEILVPNKFKVVRNRVDKL